MAVQFDREVIGSGYNISKINTNFERIQTALNESLSRSGTAPNSMDADFDLNSNDVLNGGAASFASLSVNGVDVNDIVGQPGPTGPTGPQGATGATGPAGANGVSFNWMGTYSGATAYAANDVVFDQDSSWIALTATTGHAPPTLPTTSNTYWELMVKSATSGGASALDDLTDVTITAAATGDVLRYNGTAWVDYADSNYAKSGANTDITSMSGITGGIGTADYFDLDTAATPSTAVGRFMWDGTVGAPTVGLLGGNVSAQIGNQMYAYVTNDESTTINKGQPVYMFSAQGDRLSVKLAYNTGDATSAKTLGLAAESIAAGQTGYIITQGVIKNVNTAAYTAGDTLYLGATAGTLTATKPYAPNHLVYIGTVARANMGSGEIYVRPQNGYELEELHDVSAQSPTNGDVLRWNSSTSLWEKYASSNFQPADADLTTIAGLTATTDSFLQAKSSAWTTRTPTQVTADLIAMVGDSGSGGLKGLVPAPSAGDGAAGKFLSALGTWAAPSSSSTGGTRLKVFSAGAIYTPASDVQSVLVIMTAAGGGGSGHYGVSTGASAAAGATGGGAGGGGGTLIFALTRAQLFSSGTALPFTLTVGTGALAQPNNSTVATKGGDTILQQGSTVIATALGGVSGTRGVIGATTANVLHGVGGDGGNGTVNATWLPAGSYLLIPGESGESDGSVYAGNGANTGVAKTAAGGSSYWGRGPASGKGGSGTQSSTATQLIYNGANATVPGTGGGAGALLVKNTTSIPAASQPVGGAGAPGRFVIMEIL